MGYRQHCFIQGWWSPGMPPPPPPLQKKKILVPPSKHSELRSLPPPQSSFQIDFITFYLQYNQISPHPPKILIPPSKHSELRSLPPPPQSSFQIDFITFYLQYNQIHHVNKCSSFAVLFIEYTKNPVKNFY